MGIKRIYLNLKRFDISPARGGVNRLAPIRRWGRWIVEATRDALGAYDPEQVGFTLFFPEAHLLGALEAAQNHPTLQIGCQGVYREDTAPGGNFGAFTTQLTANSAAEMGCATALIGHCEERGDKRGILQAAGCQEEEAVDRLLNLEVKAAQRAGLSVLFCVGERSQEQTTWERVLARQLAAALEGTDPEKLCIAYEPVWSIGPGKEPADGPYIAKVSRFLKRETGGLPVVYGGGLKLDNARMLASLPEIDGGLIALTRFTGEIGFYPQEYLDIVTAYLEG